MVSIGVIFKPKQIALEKKVGRSNNIARLHANNQNLLERSKLNQGTSEAEVGVFKSLWIEIIIPTKKH